MPGNDQRPSAPYMSFRTFLTGLDILSQALPETIDPTLFTTFSGVNRREMIRTLRFLNLIDDNNHTQPQLRRLVTEAERKPILQEILTNSYESVMRVDLATASPQQLSLALQEYGVKGDTLRKAETFFLQAAEYSGLALSPHLVGRTRPRGQARPAKPGRRRRPASAASAGGQTPPSEKPVSPHVHRHPGGESSRTLDLRSGGQLRLSISVDIFALSPDDRSFVFQLIDMFSAYESGHERDRDHDKPPQ